MRTIELKRDNRIIRLNAQNVVYSDDILASFDYYFGATEPFVEGDNLVVDYSVPRLHTVNGYIPPVFFPSIPEPLTTARQYVKFARLRGGHTVLDLGAYAGLTSMVFKTEVGESGRVIAVEADPENLKALYLNVAAFWGRTGCIIDVHPEAVWSRNGNLKFSSEGCMGSAAIQSVGYNRGESTVVPCSTLSRLASLYTLTDCHFLKADIEGAEAHIFKDKAFFDRFRPRIIVEPHNVHDQSTEPVVITDLMAVGYTCRVVVQEGVNTLPLIEAVPTETTTKE